MKKLTNVLIASLIAICVVGCTGISTTSKTASTLKFDKEVDYLVIGAGGAGLSSAVEASDKGVENILVIDKMPSIGGTTFVSQGMIAGYNTQVQKADNSVEASFEQMYANLMKNSSYRLDQDLAGVTVKRSGETIDWLVDRVGVKFQPDVLVGYGPLEMMHVVEGNGMGLNTPFVNALSEAGVEVMTETKAVELLVDNGVVVGAVIENNGEQLKVKAKATLIATGGYSSNPELTTLLSPEFKGTYGIGHPSHTGDGLIMASNIGAAITHTDDLMAVIKDYEIMEYHNGTSASASVAGFTMRPTNTIFVGKEGKRFVNERKQGYMSQDLNGPVFDQMHKDNLGYVWAITDEASVIATELKRSSGMEYLQADTIEELASLMEVDVNGLTKTINDYNTYAKNGFDPEFKRTANEGMTPLVGPYYAMSFVPCEIITYGGVARNQWSEVIRADASVIEGLYVAGEAAANSAYMGFTISNAMTWGRIAGANAADYILGNSKAEPIIDEVVVENTAKDNVTLVPENLIDGEYSATVEGQNGELTVNTTITGGVITNVTISSHHETESIAKNALVDIPTQIVERNSLDVDTSVGATLTTARIVDAVTKCIEQAEQQ